MADNGFVSLAPADRRAAVTASALGIACFAVAAVLPRIGLYTSEQVGDVKLFERFGDQMLDGRIPYHDFFVEYPPGALPAFALPALTDGYTLAFKLEQIALGSIAIALMVVTLALLRAPRGRLHAAAAFAGLAPLALGPTTLNRYDLWPAALLAGALAALVARRHALGLALLAVAVLAKGYAVVVLPPALLYVRRRGGPRALRRGSAAFAAVAVAIVAPFAAVGAGGLRESLRVQLGRGLHLESLGGSLLAGADRLGVATTKVVPGFAFELEGRLPDTVALLSTLAELGALIAVWVAFARGPASGRRLVACAAASVAIFAALGKVLSPQFLIWLVPLVPLVGGIEGLAGGALLLAALGLTQSFFPARYREVVALEGATWLVVARNLVLVALAATLATAVSRQRE